MFEVGQFMSLESLLASAAEQSRGHVIEHCYQSLFWNFFLALNAGREFPGLNSVQNQLDHDIPLPFYIQLCDGSFSLSGGYDSIANCIDEWNRNSDGFQQGHRLFGQ
jgi:hypothetical protein